MAIHIVLVDGSYNELGLSSNPISIVLRNSSGTEVGTETTPFIFGEG